MPTTDQRIVRDRFMEGSLDYNLTYPDALKMEIRVEGKLRTLAWVVDNKPERLELLIDTMEPGSVLFQAITLVYNENIDAVLLKVTKKNSEIRQAQLSGLAQMKNDAASTKARRYLTDVGLMAAGATARRFLTDAGMACATRLFLTPIGIQHSRSQQRK